MIKSNVVCFDWRGKSEYSEKNLWEKSREAIKLSHNVVDEASASILLPNKSQFDLKCVESLAHPIVAILLFCC